MRAVKSELGKLENIGATIEARLREVGIRTPKELERVGAVGAYQRIQAAYPSTRLPVCYYLYSLEGALRGVHWNDLPPDTKEDLLAAIERPPRRGRRRPQGKR